jgi:3-dehydroquinate dehydratase-2
MTQKKILIVNGPNLNLLHKRNYEIYGDTSLDKAKSDCQKLAKELDLEIEFKQSNLEGEIINFIQDAIDKFDGLIINAAAYSHTSIAIRDALEMFDGKKIELHISNVFKREKFRQHSMISDVVNSVMCGFGIEGYALSLFGINKLLDE